MKSVFVILGNGFTIDFISKYNAFLENKKEKRVCINVQNLFQYGEVIGTPWDDKPGFLSYKVCPALWTLGARPNNNAAESNALIEEIISCANMFFDFINDPNQKAKRLSMINSDDDRIYLRAYCELIVYLRQLFSWYNSLIDDVLLKEFVSTYSDWGWLSFLQNLNLKEFKKIIFVSYNYDVWLERILKCLGLNYSVYGFDDKDDDVIEIIKPHGSISFVPKNHIDRYEINYNVDVDGLKIDELELKYDGLTKYSTGAIIPPAGDSARLQITSSWASTIRNEAIKKAKELSNNKESIVVMCGISYWHVDRREIDELLINLNSDTELTFINPVPPRDLNAVLISIFKNYVLQTSSDNIGGIING